MKTMEEQKQRKAKITTSEVIAETVSKTVRLLFDQLNFKPLYMTSIAHGSAFQRTEQLLKDYPYYKANVCDYCSGDYDAEVISETNYLASKYAVDIVERAMKKIKAVPYVDIIKMRYFQGFVIEDIADHFDVSLSTVQRHSTRMIKILARYVIPEQVIRETMCE